VRNERTLSIMVQGEVDAVEDEEVAKHEVVDGEYEIVKAHWLPP
jgi:hypothetical protein